MNQVRLLESAADCRIRLQEKLSEADGKIIEKLEGQVRVLEKKVAELEAGHETGLRTGHRESGRKRARK